LMLEKTPAWRGRPLTASVQLHLHLVDRAIEPERAAFEVIE
jgi:hypothetical protein